jgi:oligoendopeptidase F
MEKKRHTWDLSEFYKSIHDPKIENDIKIIENFYKSFSKKYKSLTFLKSDSALLAALIDYKKLLEKLGKIHPLTYLHFFQAVDQHNEKLEPLIVKYSSRLTKAYSEMIFFTLSISKLDQKRQDKILKDKKFSEFKYFLERLFISGKHALTEKEENMSNLFYEPAFGMWERGVEKATSEKKVNCDGKEIPLPEAFNKLTVLPTDKRRELHYKIMTELKKDAHFATCEINALYNFKKIQDDLRKYKKPYDATLESHEIDEKTLNSLRKAISNNISIPKDFYKIKAKMLGLEKLKYPDRVASVGEINMKCTFEESCKLFTKALDNFDDSSDPKLGSYSDIFDNFLKNNQLDVYPKQGKVGGAFCAGGFGHRTYVLLNHADTQDSFMTLAHEMGHGFHAEFSKTQSVLYEGHTIAVAEVASTFFERIAFDEILAKASPEEKKILLHDRLQDDVQTIFRQMACFEFENALHELIRKNGAATTTEILDLMNKHMSWYLGDAFELTPEDAYLFVHWGHLRRFFYVYSYAYGQIISRALYEKSKQDKSYKEKIKKFLSAGGSMTPHDIFKSIGINTADPKFFEGGLKSIEGDLSELEKLVS